MIGLTEREVVSLAEMVANGIGSWDEIAVERSRGLFLKILWVSLLVFLISFFLYLLRYGSGTGVDEGDGE